MDENRCKYCGCKTAKFQKMCGQCCIKRKLIRQIKAMLMPDNNKEKELTAFISYAAQNTPTEAYEPANYRQIYRYIANQLIVSGWIK